MKYSYSSGIENSEAPRKLLVSIPVIAALLLLIGLGTKHHSPPSLTTGSPHPIAIKTLDLNTSPNGGSSGGSGGAGGDTGSALSGGVGASTFGGFQPASGGVAGNSSSSLVGGRGGAVSPASSPAPAPAPSPPSGGSGGGTGGTIACDNSSGLLPITCSTCAPAVAVGPGQKAIFQTGGACITIN